MLTKNTFFAMYMVRNFHSSWFGYDILYWKIIIVGKFAIYPFQRCNYDENISINQENMAFSVRNGGIKFASF